MITVNFDTSDLPDTIPNEQRGCGYLKESAAYLRADIGPSGDGFLPPFVAATSPIPYKEPHSRSWQTFPGIQFETATQGDVTEYEPVAYDIDWDRYAENHPLFEEASDVPQTELGRHLTRLKVDDLDAEHVGSMTVSRSPDLLMWVGESHYDEADEFVRECVTQGLNKRVPVSKNKVPIVNPGRTRLWLIHPNAIPPADDDGEATPGIIGYSYLTRTIYVEDADGHVPEHVQSKQRDGLLDVVEKGPEVAYTDGEHVRHGEFVEDDEAGDEEADEEEEAGEDEAVPLSVSEAVDGAIGDELLDLYETNPGEALDRVVEGVLSELEDYDGDVNPMAVRELSQARLGDLSGADDGDEGSGPDEDVEDDESDADGAEDGSDDADAEAEADPDPVSPDQAEVPQVDDW